MYYNIQIKVGLNHSVRHHCLLFMVSKHIECKKGDKTFSLHLGNNTFSVKQILLQLYDFVYWVHRKTWLSFHHLSHIFSTSLFEVLEDLNWVLNPIWCFKTLVMELKSNSSVNISLCFRYTIYRGFKTQTLWFEPLSFNSVAPVPHNTVTDLHLREMAVCIGFSYSCMHCAPLHTEESSGSFACLIYSNFHHLNWSRPFTQGTKMQTKWLLTAKHLKNAFVRSGGLLMRAY